MQRLLIFLLMMAMFSAGAARAQEVVLRGDLMSIFERAGVSGTFVLLDASTNQMVVVNEPRAAVRFIPASTFKLANSLIALEVGAVKGVHEVIPYGGQPQPIQTWEQDMTLGEAFRVSNVPVFQELARRVGRDEYAKWLLRLSYGNARADGAIDRFWLEGPLKISAIEQVRFLMTLAQEALPLSSGNQSLVRTIAKVGRRGEAVLHGKTGWTTAPDPDIGWFVGWVEGPGSLVAFALNMDVRSRADVRLRKQLALQFLRVLDKY